MIELITGTLLTTAQEEIFQTIINKCKPLRATNFFEELVELNSLETVEVDIALRKVLESKEAEEKLYEAYRKVCLAASKSLGPKIIAYVTSVLLIEDRFATEAEEQILLAAESMNDKEFIEFSLFCEKELVDKPIVGQHVFEIHKEFRDTNLKYEY